MVRMRHSQHSFSRGQIDAAAARREDTRLWKQALAVAENVVVSPVGALTLRPGFVDCGPLRPGLVTLDMTSMSVSMPAGGDTTIITDGDDATSTQTDPLAAGAETVVVTIDAGADVMVQAVDVNGYACEQGRHEKALRVQAQVNGGWQDFGAPADLSQLTRRRRFCLAPGASMTARYWRIVAAPAADSGRLTLAEVRLHGVGAPAGAARLVDMTSEAARVYLLVLTEGHADVHDDAGNWLAGVALPHSAACLSRVTWAQKSDTVLLFHPDVRPWRIQRQGADDQWQGAAAPLANIPNERFPDTTYTNAQNCIQKVYLLSPENGKSFSITCEGTTTRPIKYTGTAADRAADIKAALEDLPNVKPGITVTAGTDASGIEVHTVEFSGDGNAGRDFLLMEARFIDSAYAFAEVEKTQPGKKGGEPVISDARGWPATGCFHQNRLLLAGFRSLRRGLLMSRLGEYFDFDTEFEGAAGAIYDLIDMDDPHGIVALQPGRVLQIFCGAQVFYLDNKEIDREKPRNYVRASDIGARPGARVAPLRGSTIYIGASGQTLEEYVYSDVEASYGVAQVGYLWHELIAGATDLDRRRHVPGEQADMLYLLRADGDIVAFSGMREQNILGATRWRAAGDGRFVSLVTTTNDRLFVVTERAGALHLELAEAGELFDAAAHVVNDPPATSIGGLDHLEGREVWALADGEVIGPLVVSGGHVTLPSPAADVHVGLWRPPLVETLPLRPEQLMGSPAAPLRIYAVTASLHETGALSLGTSMQAPRPVALSRWDAPADVPLMQRLYSAEAIVDGLQGLDPAPSVVITQPRPGPLTLLALDIHFTR